VLGIWNFSNQMQIRRLGEKKLIQRLSGSIRTDRSVVKGIGDDCAVLRFSSTDYGLLACDMLVEGVHFMKKSPPAAVGWKGLGVNLSDVAAMGGKPRWAVVSLGLPPQTKTAYVDQLYKGLRRCAHRYGVNLVGGDTVRARQVVVNVALFGAVEKSRLVLRSQARAGDILMVTGRLGGSLASGKHLRFTPRLKEARSLVAHAKPHAMIDLSDGLFSDLGQLCRASRLGAWIESERIPCAKGSTWKQALTDGEDFELLLAVGPNEAESLFRWAKKHLNCRLTPIGRMRAKPKTVVVTRKGRPVRVSAKGFSHF
jgi:thiamine-monophosphate kinase